MLRFLLVVSGSFVLVAAAAGCENAVDSPAFEPGADDDENAVVFDIDNPGLDADGVGPLLAAEVAFVRLGVRFNGPQPTALELRASADGETFSDWQRPTLVFSEDGAHAGHIDVPAGSVLFQHRVTGGAAVPFVALVPITEVGSPAEGTLEAANASTAEQGLNVAIQSRSAWGARAPNCRSSTGVRRATIHHTAGANDDNTAVPVQLRQIQAFHMNSRGWCDIGYNFLVSRDGRIWEGRGYGTLGAHAENANSDNMGISFIGNYSSVAPPLAQQIAAAKTLRYLKDRAGIPLERTGDNGVKGHRQRGTTATTCPGDALYARLGDIVARARNNDFDQGPCQTGNFDGAFCDDEGSGNEVFHNRLKNQLEVDFHCADKGGNPAYCPVGAATRKDAIFVLGKAADMPTAGHPDAFPDDDGKREVWFNAAKVFGIIHGINGKAMPDKELTRSSLAVILDRMYALPAATKDWFDDDNGTANEAALNRSAEAGLILGYADANGGKKDVRPTVIANRSTLAVVAWRARNLTPVWAQ